MRKDAPKGEQGGSSPQFEDIVRRLEAATERLEVIEEKVGELERQQRVLFMQAAGTSQPESNLQVQFEGSKLDLLSFLEELESKNAKPDIPKEGEGLLEHVTKSLNEGRRNYTNIYHLLIRILLKQEVQNSRSKLLFISMNNKDLDLGLFDELTVMEEFISNPLMNTEELSLRWKIFEDRTKRELERLNGLEAKRAKRPT